MTHQNRLADETSPYLQQHADNPVDWYPWGPEALDKAAREGKPILLSIGYSACHWCHVMAHESFEDEDTARIMNAHFVNVKVDREERPDLDRIYQHAHMLLARRGGGWPLTVFLMPQDQVPFFAGTYFPPEPRHGLPAFRDLLQRLAEFFRTRRSDLDEQNASMAQALGTLYAAPAGHEPLSAAAIDQTRAQLEHNYDEAQGGFGGAPKFPHPTHIDRLLRHQAATGDEGARRMALVSLYRMAEGGIHDHLAGGFCRYSVDEFWMIPHFEKMLYDNGQLLALYAQAHAVTGDAYFADVARDIVRWADSEMRTPEGAFCSSLDADSEGHEGKFYVWERDEVKALLGDDFKPFARRYGLDRPANFEGHWHLHGWVDADKVAQEFGMTPDALAATLERARATLLDVRNQRVRPGRDDKILTSWNALMIRGLAIAARHLDDATAERLATGAVDFLRETLWRDDRLYATHKNGRTHLSAYLDDHAFLLDALLELLQLRWRAEDLDLAVRLAERILGHFEDREHGGFYFTADDHERLIQRPRTLEDEATPAGYGVATVALARLGWLLVEPRYLEASERALRAAAAALRHSPAAHCTLVTALEEHLDPPTLLILRGRADAMPAWQRDCLAPYAPGRLCFAIPDDASDLPSALADKTPQDEVVAYVCRGTTCSEPLRERAALRDAITQRNGLHGKP
ncbi:MAG: thioredoxin domain-containing protein [Ectothiorhodospiraceae bacterium]|jgi:uncharacterized protein YyaL (SSP411 family)|nr:thioredoxin domain-containing protein [Ectothiorhodospiraceae bacterium]